MCFRLFQAVLLLMCCSLIMGDAKGGEERHAQGNFKIEFPGNKKSVTGSSDLKVGIESLQIHMFSAQSDAGLAFTVMYVDYPKHVMLERGPAELLRTVRQSAVSNLGGTVVGIGSLKEHRGQQVSFEGKARKTETEGQLQIFLVENRLYQLLVWGPKDKFRKEAAQNFFRSFSLLRSN